MLLHFLPLTTFEEKFLKNWLNELQAKLWENPEILPEPEQNAVKSLLNKLKEETRV